jgi:hypothetical protein
MLPMVTSYLRGTYGRVMTHILWVICSSLLFEHGHRNRRNLAIQDGDFPVRKVLVYQRLRTTAVLWS